MDDLSVRPVEVSGWSSFYVGDRVCRSERWYVRNVCRYVMFDVRTYAVLGILWPLCLNSHVLCVQSCDVCDVCRLVMRDV